MALDLAYHLALHLLNNRIIYINGTIDDDTAASVVAQLLLLESQNPLEPIRLYINSPGGSVTSSLAIHDTMQYILCPVSTVCLGQAASMGSLLLAAGAPGERWSLPNATIMMHQPSGWASGQASDISIQAREILKVREKLSEIYVRHSGQELSVVEKYMERDTFMSPVEAKEFGLIDEVIVRRPFVGGDDDVGGGGRGGSAGIVGGGGSAGFVGGGGGGGGSAGFVGGGGRRRGSAGFVGGGGGRSWGF